MSWRTVVVANQAGLFLDSVIRHRYNVLMVESCEHTRLSGEQRYIVDESLCEIS